MTEPREDVLKPGVTLLDRRGVEWRRARGYQEQDKARPGWMLLVSAGGETMPFPEVVERYGTLGPAGGPPWDPTPRLGLDRQPEPVEGPLAPPRPPAVRMAIETRPQDWAETARRILRERGAWRGRA